MAQISTAKPVFPSEQFAFGSREIPGHIDRFPLPDERDDTRWAIQSVRSTSEEEKDLIAVNISEEDILTMLVSARFGHLSTSADKDCLLDGNEVEVLAPRELLTPIYEEGLRSAGNLGPVAVAA